MSDVPNFVGHCYVGHAYVVIRHPVDERTRYKMAEVEEAFGSLVRGEIRATNVPSNAPPEAPRFQIGDGAKQLLVSNSQLQLGFGFDLGAELKKSLEIIKKKAADFCERANKYKDLTSESRIGIVVQVNRPASATRGELASYLARHLYKGTILGELNAFEIKLSFNAGGGVLKNFSFNVYETKEFQLNHALRPNEVIQINVETIPTKEIGLMCTLDVNSGAVEQPSGTADFMSSVKTVLDALDQAVDESFNLVPMGT